MRQGSAQKGDLYHPVPLLLFHQHYQCTSSTRAAYLEFPHDNGLMLILAIVEQIISLSFFLSWFSMDGRLNASIHGLEMDDGWMDGYIVWKRWKISTIRGIFFRLASRRKCLNFGIPSGASRLNWWLWFESLCGCFQTLGIGCWEGKIFSHGNLLLYVFFCLWKL